MTTTQERPAVMAVEPDGPQAWEAEPTGSSWLVRGGIAAGPLFIVASTAHAALRDGATFSDHPPSVLSNGDLGWVQIATFVVCGLLFAGGALGLRGRLSGPGSVWGPRLLGVFGAGMVGGGIFTMDPAFGFPPGTPAGKPDEVSWHGLAHGLVFALSFVAVLAGCCVFARRYRALRRRWLRRLCLVTGPAAFLLTAWPNIGQPDGRFLPLWLGVIASVAWTTVVIGDAHRDLVRTTRARAAGGAARRVRSSL